MKKILISVPLILSTFLVSFSQPLHYPATKKVNQVDDYFGTKVADPYRWLEDDTSAAVAEWVREENAVTASYFDRIPFRSQVKERLQKIYDYPKYSAPSKHGDYYIFGKNEGLQNQPVLYVQHGLDGPPQVLIDPNKLSEDGTTRLAGVSVSNDNK
ncbi:MAG TPA: S9 family peptidase, partial [Bacteroidota bacterium]|nr:S9 family peptidase [Bacteroidota bacterium]